MFSAIKNFFGRQINHLQQAHAVVSWEEALDTAIGKISRLTDVDSEKGKKKLGLILDELRLA